MSYKNKIIIIIIIIVLMSELIYFFILISHQIPADTVHKVDWSEMIPHEVYVAYFVGWSGISSAVKPKGVPQ